MEELKFSDEQKAKIEVHIKAALVAVVGALEEAALGLAANSENKIDDVVVPVLSGPAKEALVKLIQGIKL